MARMMITTQRVVFVELTDLSSSLQVSEIEFIFRFSSENLLSSISQGSDSLSELS